MIKHYMIMGRNRFASLLASRTIKTVVNFGKGTIGMQNGINFTEENSIITISLTTTVPHTIGSSDDNKSYKTYKELESNSDVLLHFSNMESLLTLQSQVNEAVEYYIEELYEKTRISSDG